MIFRTPFFLPWLYPGLQWRIPTGEKEIYLTFDDGPIPGPTEFVLDQLERCHAKATFFCIGENVSRHPEIFQAVVRQGHAVGNHTFNHLKGWNYSVAEYLANIRLCQEEFLKSPHSLRRVTLFRPPYGRIKRSQIRALKGYSIIMWDVLSHDYSRTLSPDQCLRGTIQATRPGSIIAFHDSLKAEKNMRYTLPRFLEHFTREGYSFKALANS
ncbi:MAG TPA: polysaccharide deacetylase family protein [Cyclobacteriaceae bacterium]|nr:polysaccharide deacetylase family protein [Cyclobacteriaceae bacterium]